MIFYIYGYQPFGRPIRLFPTSQRLLLYTYVYPLKKGKLYLKLEVLTDNKTSIIILRGSVTSTRYILLPKLFFIIIAVADLYVDHCLHNATYTYIYVFLRKQRLVHEQVYLMLLVKPG